MKAPVFLCRFLSAFVGHLLDMVGYYEHGNIKKEWKHINYKYKVSVLFMQTNEFALFCVQFKKLKEVERNICFI